MCQNSVKTFQSCSKEPDMSRVHQIQLKYDAREDRTLLRISTLDKCEYQFWMTRRFTKLLWPALIRMLESTGKVAQQRDQAAKSAILAFEHEKATSNSDFATKYQEDATRTPLGTSPVLLAKVEVKSDSGKVPRLGLHPLEGRGLEIAVDDKLIHSFCSMLAKAAQSADWRLDLSIGEESAAAGDNPRRLN